MCPQTNLSLEEKQRLAKQQEQQQRFKSQPSLSPASQAKPARPRPSGNQPPPRSATKDLTSTLMESNMNAMKPMNAGQSKPPQSSSYNASNSSWSSAGPAWTGGTNSGMSMGVSGGGGFGAGQGFSQPGPAATFGMQPQGAGFGAVGMSSPRMNAQQPKPNLSAFDSLMDSSRKQTPSMNRMAGGSSPMMGAMRPTGFSQQPQQPMGMMGMNPMGTGAMGMGANTMGMGASSMGMGSPMMGMPAQQPGYGAGGGMFGQMGMGGMQGQNNAPGQMLSPTTGMPSSQKSSTNSLDDLLG